VQHVQANSSGKSNALDDDVVGCRQ